MWFWENQSLRSKKYPGKVVDINKSHSWKKISLYSYHGGSHQKFSFVDDEIVSDYLSLRLYVHGSQEVGARSKTGNIKEKWILKTSGEWSLTINICILSDFSNGHVTIFSR